MEINNLSPLQAAAHTETRTTSDGDVALHTGPSVHGTTTMVAEAPVAMHQLFTPTPHRLETHNNIISYLSRPLVYATGSFSNGGTTELLRYSLTAGNLSYYFANAVGGLGFRATVCFRLEVTASPQVSGIVKLAHFPCCAASDIKSNFRTIMSQVPNVELNIAESSACELKIPFISDVEFFPFTVSGSYYASTMGMLTMGPYLPVSWDSTTATTPSWTVYIWFEDVEIISKSAIIGPVTPQSSEAVGPISKWFSAGARVATYASSIPLISSYAAPLGWVLDAGAKVLSHFGWSKPNVPCYSGVMGMGVTRGVNTCLDQDQAQPMALFGSNAVEPINFANTDLDEMSLCYITCKPSAIASFSLQTGNSAGVVKWVCPVSPAYFVFQSSGTGLAQASCRDLGAYSSGAPPSFLPSTISFIASHFNYWRGDLVFRFKFASTKFHSGKVLVAFCPSVDAPASQAPTTIARYDFNSIVVDLRSTTEVDLDVPFVYPTTFCRTGFGSKQIDTSNGVIITSSSIANIGVVFVRVVDTIYGPDNVPQSIPVMVEVFSKCGLEFSSPCSSLLTATSFTQNVFAQSSEEVVHFEAAKRSAGERILSLKQLCMRPRWGVLTATSGVPTKLLNSLPGTFQYSTYHLAGSYGIPQVETSILHHFGSLFGLCRGSVMLRVIPAATSSSPMRSHVSTLSTVDNLGNPHDASHEPLSFESNMVNSAVFPFYSQNSRVYSGFGNPPINWRDIVFNMGGADTTSLYGTCAGDDFQFGAFSGVPPCNYLVSLASPTSYFDISATR